MAQCVTRTNVLCEVAGEKQYFFKTISEDSAQLLRKAVERDHVKIA